MERPKYQLILIFLLLSLSSLGRGVLAKPSLWDNSAFPLQTSAENTQSIFKQQVYQAYISGKMEGWKTAIGIMEKQKKNDPDFLLKLINYQYGYVAWCLGNDKKNDAKHYLSLLEKNLERLKNTAGETAEFHAYTAAAYGFKIGLSTWRAPFFGPKSMEHAEIALAKNNQSFQGNMEMGNIWNHMPSIFGRSDEKALSYYSKALEIMESKSEEIKRHNWIYLNLLTLVGQMQKEMGNTDSARKYFEQALQIEPNFIWVKEELLPSLKTD
ncbi:MAG: tetratricopeptide repeat protein [Mariniphaga sp.]|nr:tetratricopeptide repeat protein [Mariniphaga sp.]